MAICVPPIPETPGEIIYIKRNMITENVSWDIFRDVQQLNNPSVLFHKPKAAGTRSVSRAVITYTLKTCSKNHVLLFCRLKKKKQRGNTVSIINVINPAQCEAITVRETDYC